jgi:hypothetical protein
MGLNVQKRINQNGGKMNQSEYLQFHAIVCNTARLLSHRKNADYTAPDKRHGDKYAIFANFLQSERLNICPVEAGMMVRISDKISRLANLTRPGHKRMVEDERLEDTVLDAINYLILLLAYIKVKQQDESIDIQDNTGSVL